MPNRLRIWSHHTDYVYISWRFLGHACSEKSNLLKKKKWKGRSEYCRVIWACQDYLEYEKGSHDGHNLLGILTSEMLYSFPRMGWWSLSRTISKDEESGSAYIGKPPKFMANQHYTAHMLNISLFSPLLLMFLLSLKLIIHIIP